MRIAILVAAFLLPSCISPPRNRVHDVACNLESVSFWKTTERREHVKPKETWADAQLVSIGKSTGLTGSDLVALRVLETPSMVFSPSPPMVADNRTDPHGRPIVVAVQFEFTQQAADQLDRLLRPDWSVSDQSDRQAVGLAIVLGNSLFLAPFVPPSEAPLSPVQTVELPQREFSQVVAFMESALGCR